MIQNDLKYLFATSAKCSDHKISPFIHKVAKIYPFCGRGFHTPFEWKMGYKVINKQMIVQILIVKTAFYIPGNIGVKEISIKNSFEQIQENTITGLAFSARLGSAALPWLSYLTGRDFVLHSVYYYTFWLICAYLFIYLFIHYLFIILSF